jgi:hypothetical protein
VVVAALVPVFIEAGDEAFGPDPRLVVRVLPRGGDFMK